MNMEMHKPATAHYVTKDFVEICLNLAHKNPLLGIRRNGACYFSFGERERAIALSEAYWRGNLTVNLRDYVAAERLAKQLIHRSEVPNENEVRYDRAAAGAF